MMWTVSQLFDTLSPSPETPVWYQVLFLVCLHLHFLQANAYLSFWKQHFVYMAASSERPALHKTPWWGPQLLTALLLSRPPPRPNSSGHSIHSLMLATCNAGLNDISNFWLDIPPSRIVWLTKSLNCKRSRKHSALFAASSCSTNTNFLTPFIWFLFPLVLHLIS